MIFLSPQVINLLTIYKALDSQTTIGSKTQCQDKTLAIGSNQTKATWDNTQNLIETLTRSALARRDERKTQKHKTYGKNV